MAQMFGSNGNLSGGPGADQLQGLSGSDHLYGLRGKDSLAARPSSSTA